MDREGTPEELGGLQKNRLFGLVNYLGAYINGALFLQERIEQLIHEIRTIDGEKLPDFKFIENV